MSAILVTGAAGGMGRAVCNLLYHTGYEVWGLDIAPLQDVPWHYIRADLTDAEEISVAYEQIREKCPRLFAIVHMAGIYELDSLVEMSEERFRRVFEVNLMAAFSVNRCFLPLLGRGSRILITTSELAPLSPLPFTGIYAISKTALDSYAHALRMELQLLGISVSILRPGAVQTGLLSVSTCRLREFCDHTGLYPCNAQRFERIVNRVEARNISPEKIACLILKMLQKRRAPLCRSINRNPLLLLLNILPVRTQIWIIGRILKE